MGCEVVCRLLILLAQAVKPIKEKAVSKWISLDCIRSVELDKVIRVDKLLCFYMFYKSLRFVCPQRELHHRQHNSSRLGVKNLTDKVRKIIESTAVDVFEFL